MKCDDIRDCLGDDSGDLRAVTQHLKVCPECAETFTDDLKMEQALRSLALEAIPIDITEELRQTLYQTDKRRLRLRYTRKWVWILTSALAALLLAVAMPAILGWIGEAYQFAAGNLPTLDISGEINIGGLAETAESSKYYFYITFIIIAVFIAISIYLWRELKEIIQ